MDSYFNNNVSDTVVDGSTVNTVAGKSGSSLYFCKSQELTCSRLMLTLVCEAERSSECSAPRQTLAKKILFLFCTFGTYNVHVDVESIRGKVQYIRRCDSLKTFQ